MAIQTILVVDDEKDIVKIIQHRLKNEGYEVLKAYSGGEALDIIDSNSDSLSLIILDIMLPGIDGLEICKRLKSADKTKNIPVILLTVKSDESDIIRGLKMGADDYITKPFRPGILVERIKTVLRRTGKGPVEIAREILTIHNLEIDTYRHIIKLFGKPLVLTPLEYNLLFLLASNPGKAFTRAELLKNAWPSPTDTIDQAVDVHITLLRQKLGKSGALIETVRGLGYRFAESG